jgi:hypothetical protein
MLDFAGLIQLEVAKIFDYDTHYESAAIWASETYRPDYVLLFTDLFPDFQETYLSEACELFGKLPGEIYSYPRDLLIYECNK